ncbi:MAG: type II toxin-antitoxin system VapC family toxin [Candidatus Bathyarchaeia archaeon]|nr:type II toxin-antitoxin system VapC family toxin [Candidatus Bathyarchaeota archaeon]
MSLAFDSSSIFEAILKDKILVLTGNYTLDLARYELGNLVWKRAVLMKDLERDECRRLMEIIKGTLNLMEILDIGCHEADIAELAESLKLTFYDASYVFLAKSKGVPLVTEDRDIRSRVGDYVKVLSIKDF